MTHHKQKPLPKDIARLIAEEETEALARFRQRDFPGRLERAVAVDEAPAPARSHARRIPRWAWTGAVLFVIAGIMAYVAVPKRGSFGGADGEARAVAIRLPGLDGLEEWAKDTFLEPAPAIPAAGSFAAAFAAMKKDAQPADEAVSDERIRPPHLSLEKLMEILIRDRAVAKTLSLISPKFKEG